MFNGIPERVRAPVQTAVAHVHRRYLPGLIDPATSNALPLLGEHRGAAEMHMYVNHLNACPLCHMICCTPRQSKPSTSSVTLFTEPKARDHRKYHRPNKVVVLGAVTARRKSTVSLTGYIRIVY